MHNTERLHRWPATLHMHFCNPFGSNRASPTFCSPPFAPPCAIVTHKLFNAAIAASELVRWMAVYLLRVTRHPRRFQQAMEKLSEMLNLPQHLHCWAFVDLDTELLQQRFGQGVAVEGKSIAWDDLKVSDILAELTYVQCIVDALRDIPGNMQVHIRTWTLLIVDDIHD